MTTPSQLAELVRQTGPGAALDERGDRLSLRAPLPDRAIRMRWLALRAAPPPFLEAVTIDAAGSDDALEDDREPDPGEQFQIQIHKRTRDDTLALFLGASLRMLAEDIAGVSHVVVADMAADATFTTYRARFEAWELDRPAPYAASEPLADPRAFVSDFTQTNAVPADIRPWLLRTAPALDSDAYAVWRTAAVRRLLASLADRVSLMDGAIAFGFVGPPACTVTIPDGEIAHYFERAREGAVWIYAGGPRDADTRHLLLANEWARTFRKTGLADFGEGSLESAVGAYNAYVKAGSRETLKALAELRKSIVDETQKISQRAQDLISAIWKDLAVATVPFVLKVLPDAAKASSSAVAGGLALGAALFLLFSYSMQVYINHRWLAQATSARDVWKSALNLVLTPGEVADFSDTPINRSIADYKRVRLMVGFAYAALVALLLGFAWTNLATAPSAAPRPGAAGNGTAPSAMPTPEPIPTSSPTCTVGAAKPCKFGGGTKGSR